MSLGAPAVSGSGSGVATGPSGAAIRLTGVSKVYGTGGRAVHALDDVSLTVHDGEFVCLIGASGCGKSTLLNLVAGLDQPTTGQVDTSGRKVGLMFQEPALFPWLTAARQRRAGAAGHAECRGRHGGRRPRSCWRRSGSAASATSGRTSCPAACASGSRWPGRWRQNADVLLMDEPFGALDAMTRDLLHDELERICAERTLTVLFVTHNVREAARLGDRVILLSSRPGRVIDEYTLPRAGHRRIDSPEVSEVAARLTDRLREEMGRHGH